MKRRRFLRVTLATSGSLLYGSRSTAQVVNINDAINKSGRQRMLSQRLAKSYLQIGQSIDTERSKKILETSISLFDRQLLELKAFAPTPENNATLSDLSNAWIAYKRTLTGSAPNQQDAKSILVINEEVLAMAQAATVQLEKNSGTTGARLVNLSGRQRMLSQRMAKFYQAINWEIAPSDASIKLAAAKKDFLAALAELAMSPKNTQAIRSELELAQQQWVFFDNALNTGAERSSNKIQLATNVATTSERILETMDHITFLYEKQA